MGPTNTSKIVHERGELNVMATVEEILDMVLEAGTTGSVVMLAFAQAKGGETRAVLVNPRYVITVEAL